MIVISHFQAAPVLTARKAGQAAATTSLDLGRTTAVLQLDDRGTALPNGDRLDWPQWEAVAADENSCFLLQDNALEKIQFFSPELNRVYTLYPTSAAPTMLISGIPMHRIKGTDPHRDTLSKIGSLAPVTGTVLDTATGLGYTAIAAADTAVHVTTIELDPTVLEICRRNPWSQALFTRPNISRVIGDAYDEVARFEAERFSRILHDPPTFSLAGHLYGVDFYRQLYRILKPRGRLFHYIGDPGSKSGGGVTRGVVRRLREVGFRRVAARRQAFGVVAYK